MHVVTVFARSRLLVHTHECHEDAYCVAESPMSLLTDLLLDTFEQLLPPPSSDRGRLLLCSGFGLLGLAIAGSVLAFLRNQRMIRSGSSTCCCGQF